MKYLKSPLRWPVLTLAGVVGAAASFAVVQISNSSDIDTAQAAVVAPATANPSPTQTRPAKPKRVIGVNTGPTAWRGERLRHPNGGGFASEVVRWANVVVAVMEDQRIPRKYLPGILAQIDQESDGDPNLVNDYDSNAAAGTPSKGLLQIIAPTYQSNAKPGYRNLKYQTVPYTNIWASLRYVKQRYGMDKFADWNAGQNWAY